jgi:hypothetical protein
MSMFVKSESNFKVKKKGLVIRNTDMKSLSLSILQIWPMLKFLKIGSNVTNFGTNR